VYRFCALFDDRLCSIEKIDQRLGRWQGFLNLFKLCVAKAGNVADELDEPVFQHFVTSLVPSQLPSPSGRNKVQLLPNRRQLNEEVVGGEF